MKDIQISSIKWQQSTQHCFLLYRMLHIWKKNTAILCGVQFLLMYDPPSPVISSPASFSRCGFSFCLRRTNWDTGQLCTFNSAFGYGCYGWWSSSSSLYCRWAVQSRFFHLLHRFSWKDNYAMSSCLRIPYIQCADSMRKPLILKINHDQS